mgnify:CR=1 FL=1
MHIEDNRVDEPLKNLPLNAPIFDIGITSIQSLSKGIKSAGTIILNGPAGVFEMSDFALGTIEILNACAEGNGYAVMGWRSHCYTSEPAWSFRQDGPCFNRRGSLS